MIEEKRIRPEERRALDQLGANFDALLARTPEPAPRKDRRPWVLAGSAVAMGLAALIVWAAWPGDSTVDSALGDLADVAAQQTTPAPNQFVESESVVTNLARAGGGKLDKNVISQHAWLSMARPGVIETRSYVEKPNGGKERYVARVNPMPVYRIAGEVYRPREIAAFAEKPEQLVLRIDAKTSEVGPRFRPAVKWKYLVDPLKAIAPPLPSSIRAALIGELEAIPGVRGPVKRRDPRGRDGLGLNLDDDSLGLVLGVIFDPDDAQILQAGSVIADPGVLGYRTAQAGQTFESYLLLASRVVDTAPRIVSKSR